MKSIREKFEEIWPVPECLYWDDKHDGYMLRAYSDDDLVLYEWNDRLDTFTRCQETTDVYVSLVDEMVMEIEGLAVAAYGCVPQQSQDILDRAKQILEQSK